jgi:hypothetical protein
MNDAEVSCALVVLWYVILGAIATTRLRASTTLKQRIWWVIVILANIAGIVTFVFVGLWLRTFQELGVIR